MQLLKSAKVPEQHSSRIHCKILKLSSDWALFGTVIKVKLSLCFFFFP